MENMTQYPLTPVPWYPVHCAICIQAGNKTPATWIVNKGQGTNSYFACTIHKDQLEKHGTAILRRKTKNAV
jgi:hypothetical protein